LAQTFFGLIWHYRNLWTSKLRVDSSFCHNLTPLLCIIGHGLPVLNEEGNLASQEADNGSWVSGTSSSEVQISLLLMLFSACFDLTEFQVKVSYICHLTKKI
jgi:hypothetical protein